MDDWDKDTFILFIIEYSIIAGIAYFVISRL